MKSKLIFFLLPFFLFSLQTEAQTNQRGRTTDGRAYRIDKEGMKLVDQIAELEVTIDDLNRRIIGLENEIDEKDRKLKRVSEGKAVDSEISERDLFNTGPKAILPAIGSDQNCGPLLTPLQARISQLEKDLSDHKAINEALNNQIAILTSQQKSLAQKNDFFNGRVDLEKNAAREQLLRQSQDYETELKNQQQDVLKLKAGIQNQVSEISRLQDNIKEQDIQKQELNQKIESLNNKIASLESSISVYEKAFASQTKIATLNESSRSASKTQYKDSLYSHGSGIQRELNEKINNIQKLISDRKSLYDRLKESRSNVLVSMQPLKTSHGETLDEVRKQITSISSEEEGTLVLEKLSDIEQVLNDDLKVLKRLSKI